MWRSCCSWLCSGITATVDDTGSSWHQAYTNPGFSPAPESPDHLCKACGGHFEARGRRHVCVDCKKTFCGRCSVQLVECPRLCHTCRRFQGTLFERAQLMRLKVRELRDYLHLHEVPTQTCREKEELVELVLGQQTPPPSSSSSSSSVGATLVLGQRHVAPSCSSSSSSSSVGMHAPNHPLQHHYHHQHHHQHHPQAATAMGHVCDGVGAGPGSGAGAGPGAAMHHPLEELESEQLTEEEDEDDEEEEEEEEEEDDDDDGEEEGEEEEEEEEEETAEVGQEEEEEDGGEEEEEEEEEGEGEDEEEALAPGHRTSLSDLRCLEDIDGLSVKQLKEILSHNLVNYQDCCEKWELMERVTRLYNDQKELQNLVANAKMEAEAEPDASKAAGGGNGGGAGSDEENLCRICMDSPIDCVLLECGHMVTCSRCGKRMSECPICRQFVVRAVHVFRS
ncbi:E3 ubiquitin-protein ligase rififylin-like [Engraulis encrasicolus]|uniref:E3 ubiquitin-protein ligase rififylin-like n=1 Tax=Engraulis encrasicolus TaxID=184585 RepID=UPI002FD3CBBF